MSDGKKYILTFRATRSPVPVFARLRRLLKAMLRAYGFVVEEIASVEIEAPHGNADGAGGTGSH